MLALADNPKYFAAFVTANKEKCNIAFLEALAEKKEESSQIPKIKQFAEQNYLEIAKITKLIANFLLGHPNFEEVPEYS